MDTYMNKDTWCLFLASRNITMDTYMNKDNWCLFLASRQINMDNIYIYTRMSTIDAYFGYLNSYKSYARNIETYINIYLHMHVHIYIYMYRMFLCKCNECICVMFYTYVFVYIHVKYAVSNCRHVYNM